tara:strand:- start:167 stop:349 length:183 start_codon:yes stop_codon:yes gene_type:complete
MALLLQSNNPTGENTMLNMQELLDLGYTREAEMILNQGKPNRFPTVEDELFDNPEDMDDV